MLGKVSMVIPCYNKEHYIGDMLKSVLAQKWNHLEVILINDGSSDGTRKVIEQCMPKFFARGFEIVLIDQENQGVASAVKNGLIRVTGEYVCFPDCDDLLHLEYVSALVEALERFPEVDCAVCDDMRNRWNLGFPLLEKVRGGKGLLQNTEALIPEWILGKIMPSVCVMMIRSSVIKEVNMVEHFITNICTTQEPQIWLPLLAAGKVIYHIDRPLYKSIARTGSITTSQTTVEKIYYYAEAKRRLIQATLKNNVISDIKLEYYCKLADLAFFDLVARRLIQTRRGIHLQEENEKAFVTTVNHTGLLSYPLAVSSVERTGFRITYRAVSNYLLGYVPEEKGTLEAISNTQGRLIAYGAGNVAKQILPAFLQCHIIPYFIWDQKAEEGDQLLGIPLEVPDYVSLSKDDTIILLLNGNRDVEEELEKYDTEVIYYEEVLDALAIKHFPELAVVKYD
ncbi:glycosyltransferase family 2 protein [Clostridium sp. WB02_MRS01]|uniref:glycosyltransferase family 2 protein n=1 Tax=Clostridium sp. WB02_MRS01 TaxID=2605777 RepID=UPI0018A6AAA4|nr:glycosyltransferase family 2 protein [Clostridium sp. WB02_MRS01]